MRYEVALEVESGYIVWAHGGFPAGSNRDVDIAQKKFVKKLKPSERAIADKGYMFCKRLHVPKMAIEVIKRSRQF